MCPGWTKWQVAEGVGFEPTIRLPVYTLSKRAPSATRPSLRVLAGGPNIDAALRAQAGQSAGRRWPSRGRGPEAVATPQWACNVAPVRHWRSPAPRQPRAHACWLFFRFLAALFLLIAVIAAVYDGTRSMAADRLVTTSLLRALVDDRADPAQYRAGRRSSASHPLVWDAGLGQLLQLPACARVLRARLLCLPMRAAAGGASTCSPTEPYLALPGAEHARHAARCAAP